LVGSFRAQIADLFLKRRLSSSAVFLERQAAIIQTRENLPHA
jgi:hypothetical protein